MNDIINRYQSIIETCTLSRVPNPPEIRGYTWQASIKFKDGTRLEAREKVYEDLNKRSYSYQYMQADNTLIIRWDNAPHPHPVDTMPHHKHVGSNENILPSEPMTLEKVLQHIARIIALLLFFGLGIGLLRTISQ